MSVTMISTEEVFSGRLQMSHLIISMGTPTSELEATPILLVIAAMLSLALLHAKL